MKSIYAPFQPTLSWGELRKLGLKLKSAAPCNALKGSVYAYLQISCERPTPYPVMPDGTQAIFISPRGSMVGGAQTEARDMQLPLLGEYFGIWFYPSALRNFFNLDLSEISGKIEDSRFFECSHFSQLHNQIYSYENFSERVSLCENWLLKNYSRSLMPQFDQALALIYHSAGNERIGNIANRVGWSTRHLNRQFLQHTGLSPKVFSNVIRVQNVCKKLYYQAVYQKNNTLDLGYYDQAHMIKEFKKYFKSTPSEFIEGLMSDFYNT